MLLVLISISLQKVLLHLGLLRQMNTMDLGWYHWLTCKLHFCITVLLWSSCYLSKLELNLAVPKSFYLLSSILFFFHLLFFHMVVLRAYCLFVVYFSGHKLGIMLQTPKVVQMQPFPIHLEQKKVVLSIFLCEIYKKLVSHHLVKVTRQFLRNCSDFVQ